MKKPFVRGYSLAEILVAAFLGSILLVGLAEFMAQTLRMGRASRVTLIEQDFLATINKVLEDEESCKESLKSDNLTGGKINNGIGHLKTVGLSLKEGTDTVKSIIPVGTFKDSIEVVFMRIKQKKGKTNAETLANERTEVREFTAFYKKIGLGKLNTVAGGNCKNEGSTNEEKKANMAGCFRKKCTLSYKFEDASVASNARKFSTCEAIDCHTVGPVAKAGFGPKCAWGEIFYNKKEREADSNLKECDPRDKPPCKGTNDTDVTFGQWSSETGLEEKNGKCVCESERTKTAEGLCIKKQQAYGSKECWPRQNNESDYGSVSETTWNNWVKLFCSKEYQGVEPCFLNHKSNKKVYYKRLYNRETGQVSCATYDQDKYNDTPPPESWFLPQTL